MSERDNKSRCNQAARYSGKLGDVVIYAVYAGYLIFAFVGENLSRPVWTDEILTYFHVSGKSFEGLIHSFSVGVNALPYLYFILVSVVDKLFGLDQLTLRLPSLVFSYISVILTHSIIRRYCGQWIATIAVVSGLLVSEQFLDYSAEARPYSMVLCFVLLNVWTGLVRDPSGGRAFLFNALTSFLAPSVHYIGLFYSGAIAVACLMSGKENRLRSFFSFACGWSVFVVIHFSQIYLFLSGKTLVAADIQPPVTIEVFRAVFENYAGLAVSVALMCLFINAFLGKDDAASKLSGGNCVKLSLVGLGFALIPMVYFFLAWVGLPNLTLDRYYFPSILAGVFLVVTILCHYHRLFCDNQVARYRFIRLCLVVFLMPALCIPVVRYLNKLNSPTSSSWAHVVAPYAVGTSAEDAVAVVTNNIHIYFALAYHLPELRPRTYFLRETKQEADGWEKFHSEINSITPSELTRWESFKFFTSPGTLNSFPHFKIQQWASENDTSLKLIGNEMRIEMFALDKE